MNIKRNIKFPSLNCIKKFSTQVIPSTPGSTPAIQKPQEVLSEISKNSLNLSPEEFLQARKTGSDLFLTKEKLQMVQSTGFFFNDVNDKIDLNVVAKKGWKLQYLKNMLLLQDYTNIFREFMQSCALNNPDGLNLTCEKRFKTVVQANINQINRLGFNIELESLKILQEFKVLRVEVYKNLKINRDENSSFINYKINSIPTPLAPIVIAHKKGDDDSVAKDSRPFILATTMLVRSPMKMAIMNQNLSKKLHGMEETQPIDYVVRFESQFNYTDFAWVLPTQNKPKRNRHTKITDFNNILRGNPFFDHKFDLSSDSLRYKYMGQDERLDDNVRSLINTMNRF
jgi:hypothetical protein